MSANQGKVLKTAVDLNTAKVGITTTQADAITANTAKVSIPAGGVVGQTLINTASGTATWQDALQVETVSSLPASPTAGVLYLVEA